MGGEKSKPGLARSLGGFFGGIVRGFTAPIEGEKAVVERRESVEEEEREGAHGEKVTLRRTVIEEVEVERGKGRDGGG